MRKITFFTFITSCLSINFLLCNNQQLHINDTQNLNQIQQTLHITSELPKEFSYFEKNKDILIKLAKQPDFTTSSIKCYFRHTFNNHHYAEKYLPFDLSHILTFASFVPKIEEPRAYLNNILVIFEQKLFFCNCINAFAFEEFLHKFIDLTKIYFKIENSNTLTKVKERLYTLLSDEFDALKKDPERILHEAALSINSIFLGQSRNEDLSLLELKQTLTQFLKICLAKLIWSPKDSKLIWHSIKAISILIEELLKNNMIFEDSLNTFYWIIISRFSYLINNWGNLFTVEFYENITKEIEIKPMPLYAYKENDPLVLSKFRFLNYILNQGKLRAKITPSSLTFQPKQNIVD